MPPGCHGPAYCRLWGVGQIAVSLEAAFVLIDKASGPLKDIKRNAEMTDKALRGMGGQGGMAGAQKEIQKTTQILDRHGNVLKEVEVKSRGAADGIDKTAEAAKKLGKEGEKTIGFFKNLKAHIENTTRSILKSSPAFGGLAGAIGGAGGALKGFATALPMFGTLILSLLPQIVALTGAIGALASSLAGAVGGGALLGAGLLGSFAVGLGSVAVVAKPAITGLQNYQKAVANLNKAIASGKPGQIKAAQKQVDALAKANPGVAQLARNIAGFKKEWDKATSPARNAFFRIAGDAMATLRKNVGFLAGEVNKNVKSVADNVHKYIGPLTNALKPLISGLGQIFRRNLGGFMQGAVNILKGLSNILKVIAPQLSVAGKGFAAFTDRFEKWTASPRGQRTVKNMTDAFKQWGRLLWEAARILGSIMGAGMKSGTGEIKKWADSLKKIADNLSKPGGAGGVAKWFKESVDKTNQMLPVVKKLADSIAGLYQVFKPLSAVTGSIIKALPAPALTALVGMVIAAKTLKGAASGASAVRGALGKFTSRGDSPFRPIFVQAVGGPSASDFTGSGGSGWSKRGMRGAEKAAEKEAEQAAEKGLLGRLGARFGGSKLGGLLGRLKGGGSSLLSKVPFLSKLTGLGGAATGLAAEEGLGGSLISALGHGGGIGGLATMGLQLAGSSLLPKRLQRTKAWGAISGIASGAGLGATLGSFLPGAGTLIGAGIGGALGGAQALGLIDPKKIGDLAKSGFNKIKGAAGDAWGWIKRHWDWLGILAGPLGLATTMIIKHFGSITRFIGSLPGKIGHLLSKVPGAVASALSSVWNVLTFPFRKAWDWISGMPRRIGSVLSSVAGVVGRALSTVWNVLTFPFRKAWGWISGLPGKIAGIIAGIPAAIGKAASGIFGAITKPFTTAFDFVKKHIPHIGFKSHKILGVSVPLPSIGLAGGGTVPYTTDVLVGEKGPEILHLPKGSQVTPNHALPTHMMATGTAVPTGAGAGPAMGVAGAGADAFTRQLGTVQAAMTALVKQSQQIFSTLRAMTNALNVVENELASPRGGLVGALALAMNQLQSFAKTANQVTSAVSDNFKGLATDSRHWMQQIQTDAAWLGDQLNKILPPQSQTAFNAMVTNLSNTRANLQKLWQGVIGDVNWGVGQIMKSVANAFKTMGVTPPKGVAAATKAAKGARLPGPARGDHIPLLNRGGGVVGLADGGELVVNRHTESRVNSMLGGRTTLGKEVAGETTPHAQRWATGGRISTNATGGIPRYQTGGVVGEVNALASAAGFNKVAIAGILGNAMQESGLNPNTPGGGMWQQISNFGQGTGGSLQAQWARMLPQIRGFEQQLNAAGSPGAAAQIFEQQFERAGIPAMANRIKYAEQAFAGQLGAALTGGAGGFGGPAPTIKAPQIRGQGAIVALGQGALNKIAQGANSKLAASATTMGGVGFAGAAPLTGPAAVQAMIKEADQIASHHYNYEWGGGHGALGVPGSGSGHGSGPGVGFDCSGSVSAVLGAAGLLGAPMVSGSLASWGAAGPGQHVTIYANPVHTYMSIDGHFFGTSGANPGGGAGWFNGSARPGFAVRHPPGLAKGGRTRMDDKARGPQLSAKQWSTLEAHEQNRLKNDPTAIMPGLTLGGRVPWFAGGADYIARRPHVIGVGDGPVPERVTVTPQGSGRIGNHPLHVEIHKVEVHRKGDIQRIVDEELRALAATIEGRL